MFAHTIRLASAATALACFASACSSSAPPLRSPSSVDAFCGSKEARNTGIASVVSSTDDELLDEHPTDVDVRRAVRSGDGVVAHWKDQLLAIPRVAAKLGETDGYAHMTAAAIPPAPDGAQSRHIYLFVRDHGTAHWITLDAYDMQNVCVEGKPQT